MHKNGLRTTCQKKNYENHSFLDNSWWEAITFFGHQPKVSGETVL
jgi:hypothetical protein